VTKRHRARLAREQRGRCARCGRRIPHGTGELHHVDGDPSHDAPANLELVQRGVQPARRRAALAGVLIARAGESGSIRRTATDRRYGLMADPKRVVERHVEAFNARDADAEPWSEDADFVAPNASMHGREQVLGFLGVFWDAFPDGRLEASRLLAEGSVVAAEGRFTGTHTGVMRAPAGDVAATGRQVDFRWMSSYEVRGDELASEHLYFDQAELLGQLGLMPAT
jgi:predicted ester cyclase